MPFRPHPRAEERRLSAIALVKTLLQAKEVCLKHRREFLSKALWKVTEAEGIKKHKTRYCSKAALSQPGDLRHDHVFQRAVMVDALLASPADVDSILAKAIGCTITKAEHALLDKYKKLDGWERYRQAGIEVFDRESDAVFVFPVSRET